MSGIDERAKDLGGALARTDEYQALRRAMESADNDRELVAVRNRIQGLEEQLEASLKVGREPDEELKAAYTATAEELQAMPGFQQLIAAQTNFEKVMYRVNQTVAMGIEEGAKSRIIIAS